MLISKFGNVLISKFGNLLYAELSVRLDVNGDGKETAASQSLWGRGKPALTEYSTPLYRS